MLTTKKTKEKEQKVKSQLKIEDLSYVDPQTIGDNNQGIAKNRLAAFGIKKTA